MKKRLAVTLAAVMLAGSLAGCAGGGTTAAPETQAQTQAEAAKTEAEKTEAEKTEEPPAEEKPAAEATKVIGVIPKSTLFDFYKWCDRALRMPRPNTVIPLTIRELIPLRIRRPSRT